jgi:uncharacterized protein YjbI with pentapeptide repeats
MTTGDGGKAKVWLDDSGHRLVMRTSALSAPGGHSSSGESYWERCATGGCVGSAIFDGGQCFSHASEPDRELHLKQVVTGARSWDLRGNELTGSLFVATLKRLMDHGKIRHAVTCAGAIFSPRLQIEDMVFDNGVDFGGATFDDGCSFSRCEFNGGLNIGYTYFRLGPAGFMNCKIAHLSAQYCHTGQSISFERCQITGPVDAKGVQKDFRITDSQIERACDLSGSDVDHLSLSGSRFSGELTMANLRTRFLHAPGIDLLSASNLGPVVDSGAIDLSAARFKSRVHLNVDATTLNLSNASFDGGGRIDCKRAKINLASLMTGESLSVVGSDSASVDSIQNADCGRLALSSLDLSNCQFYGCHNLETMVVDSTVSLRNCPKPLRATRECIVDEFYWRERNARLRKADWSTKAESTSTRALASSSPKPISPQASSQIADLYRSLRKSVEGRSNGPGAADFYYGEMEMRRLDRSSRRGDRAIVWAYWLVSGYGLRVLRSLFWLLFIFGAGSVLFREFGLLHNHSWPTGLIAAAQSLVPGLTVSGKLTSIGQTLIVILRITGPILLGFTALALRNRVRR